MALPSLTSILLLSLLIACSAMLAQSHVEETTTTTTTNTSSLTLEWPLPTYPFGAEEDGEYSELFGPEPDPDSTMKDARRALFWHRVRYYISYGALSANRIPCPPRSGRSYYTHNCYLARGPAHPYSRGCSRITRCRR